MKVVILAGSLGTRISEETSTRPKPMVEISDKPILRGTGSPKCEFLYVDDLASACVFVMES